MTLFATTRDAARGTDRARERRAAGHVRSRASPKWQNAVPSILIEPRGVPRRPAAAARPGATPPRRRRAPSASAHRRPHRRCERRRAARAGWAGQGRRRGRAAVIGPGDTRGCRRMDFLKLEFATSASRLPRRPRRLGARRPAAAAPTSPLRDTHAMWRHRAAAAPSPRRHRRRPRAATAAAVAVAVAVLLTLLIDALIVAALRLRTAATTAFAASRRDAAAARHPRPRRGGCGAKAGPPVGEATRPGAAPTTTTPSLLPSAVGVADEMRRSRATSCRDELASAASSTLGACHGARRSSNGAHVRAHARARRHFAPGRAGARRAAAPRPPPGLPSSAPGGTAAPSKASAAAKADQPPPPPPRHRHHHEFLLISTSTTTPAATSARRSRRVPAQRDGTAAKGEPPSSGSTCRHQGAPSLLPVPVRPLGVTAAHAGPPVPSTRTWRHVATRSTGDAATRALRRRRPPPPAGGPNVADFVGHTRLDGRHRGSRRPSCAHAASALAVSAVAAAPLDAAAARAAGG